MSCPHSLYFPGAVGAGFVRASREGARASAISARARGFFMAANYLIGVFVTQPVYERHEEDLQVEHQRPVFDVVEVVLDADADGRIAAPAVDLRPSRDTGADFVAEDVVRELGAELFDELRALRARTDHAHVAEDHVEKLRE